MIKLENVTYHFDHKKGIENVSLHINKGSTWGIVGQNGSGKSTLIKCLAGIYSIQSGVLTINDTDVSKKTIAYHSQWITTIIQNPHEQLFRSTVEKEIKFTLKHSNQSHSAQKVEEILTLCEFNHLRHHHPYDLSFSQQKLLCLANACARSQDIVVLDEITSGLDEETMLICGKIVDFLKKQGKTIIIVSHDINFLSEYVENLAIMHNNYLVFKGSFKEAMHQKELFESIQLKRPDVVELSCALNLPMCINIKEWNQVWKNLRTME